MIADEVSAPADLQAPHRVLIVDDHPIMRKGVRHALMHRPELEIIGEAGSLQEALDIGGRTPPDLVVLDLVLGGRDGLDGVAEIRRRFPRAGILVFSMNPEDVFAPLALNAGANGYLVKSQDFDELHKALDSILAGHTYLSPDMVRMMAEGGRKPSDIDLLTGREMQVFLRMGEGKTTSEIAFELNLSIKTVFTHREHIKAKLNAKSGAELVRRAMTHVWGQGAMQLHQ